MSVSKWMTANPFCAQPDDLLEVVADAMRRGRFRHAPVIAGDRRVIGMITERELREQKGYWRTTKVTGALSEPAITVRADDSITAAAQIMLERQIGALPVVDGEQRIVGIVTTSDLLRALIECVSSAASTRERD